MNEEFLINSYLKKLSKNNPSSLNLNDDVFFDKTKKLVISVDPHNEGIPFLNFKKPDLVIRKIIRSSISDIEDLIIFLITRSGLLKLIKCIPST